jgi:hypothetical protein
MSYRRTPYDYGKCHVCGEQMKVKGVNQDLGWASSPRVNTGAAAYGDRIRSCRSLPTMPPEDRQGSTLVVNLRAWSNTSGACPSEQRFRRKEMDMDDHHHRYATLLQHMLDRDYARNDIDAYARRFFDTPFNEKLLNKLLDHSYQLSSRLTDSFDLFLDQISDPLNVGAEDHSQTP